MLPVAKFKREISAGQAKPKVGLWNQLARQTSTREVASTAEQAEERILTSRNKLNEMSSGMMAGKTFLHIPATRQSRQRLWMCLQQKCNSDTGQAFCITQSAWRFGNLIACIGTCVKGSGLPQHSTSGSKAERPM